MPSRVAGGLALLGLLLCIGAASPARSPQAASPGIPPHGLRQDRAAPRPSLALRGGGAPSSRAPRAGAVAADGGDHDIQAEDLDNIRKMMNWTLPDEMNREVEEGCAEGLLQMERELLDLQAEREKHSNSISALEAEAAQYLTPEQRSALLSFARKKAHEKTRRPYLKKKPPAGAPSGAKAGGHNMTAGEEWVASLGLEFSDSDDDNGDDDDDVAADKMSDDEGGAAGGGKGGDGGRAAYNRQVGKGLHEEAAAMQQHAQGNCPKHHG